jgi:hypothetical protein
LRGAEKIGQWPGLSITPPRGVGLPGFSVSPGQAPDLPGRFTTSPTERTALDAMTEAGGTDALRGDARQTSRNGLRRAPATPAGMCAG